MSSASGSSESESIMVMKKRPEPCDAPNSAEMRESEQRLKRQCLRRISPGNNSYKNPMVGPVKTSLSLLPPGERMDNKVKEENEEQEGEGSENGKRNEEEEPYLMRMMKRVIAEEVRNYIDNLRADDKLVLRTGLGFHMGPSSLPE